MRKRNDDYLFIYLSIIHQPREIFERIGIVPIDCYFSLSFPSFPPLPPRNVITTFEDTLALDKIMANSCPAFFLSLSLSFSFSFRSFGFRRVKIIAYRVDIYTYDIGV